MALRDLGLHVVRNKYCLRIDYFWRNSIFLQWKFLKVGGVYTKIFKEKLKSLVIILLESSSKSLIEVNLIRPSLLTNRIWGYFHFLLDFYSWKNFSAKIDVLILIYSMLVHSSTANCSKIIAKNWFLFSASLRTWFVCLRPNFLVRL